MKKLIILIGLTVVIACSEQQSSVLPIAKDLYLAELENWKKQRLESVTADDGWLTLAGLQWLNPGANTIGSDSTNDIILPMEAPAQVGTIFWQGKSLFGTLNPGTGVLVNGTIITQFDSVSSNYPIMTYENLTWFLIKRGEKLGVRIRDLNNEARTNFKGLEYFPVNTDLILEADFIPYPEDKTIPVDNIIGVSFDYKAPGRLEFFLINKLYSLDLVDDGTEGKYFVIMGDQTSGEETYSGGRYMYVDKPGSDNKVILDFNKAYNPPCVFTDFATCPLPPSQNILDIAIVAGEKNYKKAF